MSVYELYPIFFASGNWSYEARGIFHMYSVQSLISSLSLLSGQMLTLNDASKFSFSSFRSNVNINDALGDYSLTLVDTLDTLVVSFGIW